MSNINLLNPRDRPYGKLSNNLYYPLKIDNEDWKTATHYIFGSLIDTPSDRQIIKNANIKNVINEYNEYTKNNIKSIILDSLQKGLKVKFENDTLAKALINTKDTYIHIQDDYGFGFHETNLIGDVLMTMRNNLKKIQKTERDEKLKTQSDDQFYKHYLIYKTLVNAMRAEGINILPYKNSSGDNILNSLPAPTQDVGKKEVIVGNRNLVDDIVIDSIGNIQLLVENVYKTELKHYKSVQEDKINNIIFNMYVDSIIKTNYPDIKESQYQEVRNEQLSTLSANEYRSTYKRVINLYNLESLPEPLNTDIKTAVSKIEVPTDEEIEESEKEEIHELQKNVRFDEENISDTTKNKINYNIFKPWDESEMLTIEGRQYPSVDHYVYTKLISNLKTVSADEAYKAIKNKNTGDFYKIHQVQNVFTNKKKSDLEKRLKENTRKILDEKFKNPEFKAILLSTGDSFIIWDDDSSPVLGIGKGNYVGDYLTEIRTKLNSENKYNQSIDIRNLPVIIGDDPFILGWARNRLTDFLNTLTVVNTDVKKSNIKADKVDMIINNIYKHVEVVEISEDAPGYFKNLVESDIFYKKLNQKSVNVLWKYIYSNIYLIVKFTDNCNLKNIYTVLNNSQKKLSKFSKKTRHDIDILNSLLNILLQIVKINNSISAVDAVKAISILLNENLTDESIIYGYGKLHKDVESEEDDDDTRSEFAEEEMEMQKEIEKTKNTVKREKKPLTDNDIKNIWNEFEESKKENEEIEVFDVDEPEKTPAELYNHFRKEQEQAPLAEKDLEIVENISTVLRDSIANPDIPYELIMDVGVELFIASKFLQTNKNMDNYVKINRINYFKEPY